MISLIGYGCSSSAGIGVSHFWESLQSGISRAALPNTQSWPVQPSPTPKICSWDLETKKSGAQQTLVTQLSAAWDKARSTVDFNPADLGVIFASTKGNVEDFIWTDSPPRSDPLTPVLKAFLEVHSLRPTKSICVSNACASTHGAIFLAANWLRSRKVKSVLVLAADFIGPFVVNGFQSLKALSKDSARPFSGDRDGLTLGDGAAALLFAAHHQNKDAFQIEGIAIDNEGYAVTRPSQEGESLGRIYDRLRVAGQPVDLVIAHGTGTIENDKIEDRALTRAFQSADQRPVVTATKWCTGHTLGASGALDLIAAAEALKRQEVFGIGTSRQIDSDFQMDYALQTASRSIERVLVNSLGFGGAHAALVMNRL